ncbi:MAG: tellurite resistance TerB family protein [Rhodospirillales bacterium]
MLDAQSALIYAMVVTSAADSEIRESELNLIGHVVEYLPAFKSFDKTRMPRIAGDCLSLLDQEDGIDAAIGLIKAALPHKLRETAYALACEVAAADRKVDQSELRLLEMMRHEFGVDRLTAAAIEKGVGAKYAVE